mmetsp:Transcript_12318/g.28871  ORF Transcript_12318/g.28871 Transcript_12318/m.28871 type:complete len:202 (+) Transcript_12318:285-890(+)
MVRKYRVPIFMRPKSRPSSRTSSWRGPVMRRSCPTAAKRDEMRRVSAAAGGSPAICRMPGNLHCQTPSRKEGDFPLSRVVRLPSVTKTKLPLMISSAVAAMTRSTRCSGSDSAGTRTHEPESTSLQSCSNSCAGILQCHKNFEQSISIDNRPIKILTSAELASIISLKVVNGTCRSVGHTALGGKADTSLAWKVLQYSHAI